MNRNELLDLIPAYALGALDPDERAEVESLLATNAEAQQILADYQGMTEALSLTTPARTAPSHLSDDLRRRLAASRPDAKTAAPVRTFESPLTIVPKPPRLNQRVPLIVGAAAAIAVIIAGLLLFRPQTPSQRTPQQTYQWIMTQPNGQQVAFTTDSGADGVLAFTTDGSASVIRVSDLPQLTDEQVYQLWLVEDGSAHADRTWRFEQTEGPYYILLPLENRPATEFDAFAVSIETSERTTEEGPSSAPILAVSA